MEGYKEGQEKMAEKKTIARKSHHIVLGCLEMMLLKQTEKVS